MSMIPEAKGDPTSDSFSGFWCKDYSAALLVTIQAEGIETTEEAPQIDELTVSVATVSFCFFFIFQHQFFQGKNSGQQIRHHRHEVNNYKLSKYDNTEVRRVISLVNWWLDGLVLRQFGDLFWEYNEPWSSTKSS